jgi:hypothetical protein
LEAIGWQPVGDPVSASQVRSHEQWVVGRVAQRSISLTARCDVIFSPRLVLQLYAQPFATTGAYDRYLRFATGGASSLGSQFDPVLAAPSARSRGLLDLDLVDGDRHFERTISDPDAQARALTSNAVLRWEYRPGSFVTVAWNHRSDRTVPEHSPSLGRAIAGLFRDPATDIVMVKVSFRLGS